MNITGNTIFIPGATSGIGLALALRFKKMGNVVIIGGRRAALLKSLAAEHQLSAVQIDTTDLASIAAARDDVLQRFPELNVVIAMAGIMVAEDARQAEALEIAERTIATNVLGPVRLVAAFSEHLQTRPNATIVTVASGLAHLPLAVTPTYNASKAFIHMYSESLRLQFAGTSVKVIELVPPALRTELMPGQSQIESFLPLDDYIDETVTILESTPDVQEVLVEAAKFFRNAEIEGRYDQSVVIINAAVTL